MSENASNCLNSLVYLYPKTMSYRDPFLENLSSSLSTLGFRVRHWLKILWKDERPLAMILNWPENLWAAQKSFGRKYPLLFLKQRVLLFAIHLVRARGGKVILIAHNLFPHGHPLGREFWVRDVSKLALLVDVVCHFSNASIHEFGPNFPSSTIHVVAPFPIELPNPTQDSVAVRGSIDRILVLGADLPRKNLLPVLRDSFSKVDIPFYVSGFKSQHQARQKLGLKASELNSNITWLGKRLPNSELRALFRPGTALLLNQSDQLNSGLMWLALSRGAVVLAPKTQINLEIQFQVGDKRLRLFPHPADPLQLASLCQREIPPGAPLWEPSPVGLAKALSQIILARH